MSLSGRSSPDRDVADETSPLLSTRPSPASAVRSGDGRNARFPVANAGYSRSLVIRVIALSIASLLFIDMGESLASAARVRLYEAIICGHYYKKMGTVPDLLKLASSGIPEELCKVPAVQDRMAMLFGWQSLFENIPSIVLAVPYGLLADKVGRKPVVTLALVGLLLELVWILFVCYMDLPLELSWFGAVFLVVGGGPTSAAALVLAMVSDVVAPESRSIVFSQITASTLLGDFLAPALGAMLMEKSPWLPMILSCALDVVGILIAAFLPETLRRDSKVPVEDTFDDFAGDQPRTLRSRLQAHAQRLRKYFNFLFTSRSLIIILLSFVVSKLSRTSIDDLLLQYVSKRYEWKISQASLLLSLRAALNAVVLLILMPLVTFWLLSKARLEAKVADLWTVRASLLLMAFGFFVMGFAPAIPLFVIGLVLFTFGTVSTPMMRSISVHLAATGENDTGRVFAVVAVCEGVGALLSGPIISSLFRAGLRHSERGWLGLPYILVSALLSLVVVATMFIRFPTPPLESEEDRPADTSRG